jgi:hypothetical protein
MAVGTLYETGTLTASGEILCAHCRGEEPHLVPLAAGMAIGACDRCAISVQIPPRLARAQELRRYLRYGGARAEIVPGTEGVVEVRYTTGGRARLTPEEVGDGLDVTILDADGRTVANLPAATFAEARGILLAWEGRFGRMRRLVRH